MDVAITTPTQVTTKPDTQMQQSQSPPCPKVIASLPFWIGPVQVQNFLIKVVGQSAWLLIQEQNTGTGHYKYEGDNAAQVFS